MSLVTNRDCPWLSRLVPRERNGLVSVPSPLPLALPLLVVHYTPYNGYVYIYILYI